MYIFVNIYIYIYLSGQLVLRRMLLSLVRTGARAIILCGGAARFPEDNTRAVRVSYNSIKRISLHAGGCWMLCALILFFVKGAHRVHAEDTVSTRLCSIPGVLLSIRLSLCNIHAFRNPNIIFSSFWIF